MNEKYIKVVKGVATLGLGAFFLMTSNTAFAHIVVRPNQVGVAAFQTFTVGVPVEKDIPTTSVRLIIPEGLQHVTPNVKPGWEVAVKEEGQGESATVTEITWTGGAIPSGQRDEFLFSAQVPAKEAKVVWKAYQTYADGSVVAWDQDPNDHHGHDNGATDGGPYSETNVVNDIATEPSVTTATSGRTVPSAQLPLIMSGLALILSSGALAMQLRRKNKK